MRGVYTVQANINGVTGQKTLMSIAAASGVVVELQHATITNANNETNQQIEAYLRRASADGTGTGATARPHEANDQAATSTIKSAHTVNATLTDGIFGHQGFATLAGYFWQPTPEERVYIKPNEAIALHIPTSGVTSFDAVATLTFREI